MIPDILYKYFPKERIGLGKELGFFPNLEVSFTAPEMFNDPFDCSPFISTTEKEYLRYLNTLAKSPNRSDIKRRKRLGDKVRISDVRKEERERIKNFRNQKDKEAYLYELANYAWNKTTKSNVRVLSLSKNYDNLLMWSHYAQNHTGFVVGIKKEYLENEEKGINKDIWGFKEVTYSDEKIKLNPWSLSKEESILPFFNKSKCWEYEEEVRFVGYRGNIFIDKYCIKKIPPEFIESIRLGAKMESCDKDKILTYCKEHLPNVKIYQAQMKNASYQLDFTDITTAKSLS